MKNELTIKLSEKEENKGQQDIDVPEKVNGNDEIMIQICLVWFSLSIEKKQRLSRNKIWVWLFRWWYSNNN